MGIVSGVVGERSGREMFVWVRIVREDRRDVLSWDKMMIWVGVGDWNVGGGMELVRELVSIDDWDLFGEVIGK